MSHYKIIVRKSPGWRNYKAATLGVSVTSPNWQGEKFASILEWTATNFKIIRIDVTDALYRHNFIAQGMDAGRALAHSKSLGALWLTRHQDIIDACAIKPQIIRWSEWYKHPDYHETLVRFQNAYINSPVLQEAVHNDIMEFSRRQRRKLDTEEYQHSKNYLIEELAVICLQSRELPSLKIYPGDELSCMHVVRHGLVPQAPKGLESEQHAKIKFYARHQDAMALAAAG